jgi:hypothetical protein
MSLRNKVLGAVCAASLVVSGLMGSPAPFQSKAFAAPVDTIAVKIDEVPVAFSKVYPQRIDGRVMVPLRTVLEAMGADVKWNGEERSITCTLNRDGYTSTVLMQVDSPFVEVKQNSKLFGETSHIVRIDVPPRIMNGSTMIPLRASGEFLGFAVKWDEATRTATLAFNGQNWNMTSFAHYDLLGSIKEMKAEELQVFFAINDMRKGIGYNGLALDTRLSKTLRETQEPRMEDAYVFDSHNSITSGGFGSTAAELLQFAAETKELAILPVNRQFDTHVAIAFDGKSGWIVHSMNTHERMPVMSIQTREEADALLEKVAPTDVAVNRSLFRKDHVLVREKAGISIRGTDVGATVPYFLEKRIYGRNCPQCGEAFTLVDFDLIPGLATVELDPRGGEWGQTFAPELLAESIEYGCKIVQVFSQASFPTLKADIQTVIKYMKPITRTEGTHKYKIVPHVEHPTVTIYFG